MGLLEKLTALCPCTNKKRPENRKINVGNKLPPDVEVTFPEEKSEKFPNNRIVSSKYTAWSFLPKNLFEQFQRIANFYFLCVLILELSIESPISFWTSLLPLVTVVGISIIKQGYEDVLRHRADREVNDRICHVLRDGHIQDIKAKDITVGDIVRVVAGEGIPCDMVMISSDNQDGECYITTANLDGETNLKTFYCVPDTRGIQTETDFSNFHATIECEQPKTDLYKFVGRINIHQTRGAPGVERSLGAENILLRGARLKNTPFIYGCAIYTGQETKISLNSRYKRTKSSNVDKMMNRYLIVFLLLLMFEAGLLTGLKHLFHSDANNHLPKAWYMVPDKEVNFGNVLEEFLSFMVILNYIIPISMYVTIEFHKFVGSMFFQWDIEMFDAQANEPAKANTSDINEELGQIEYLFTDKTGTLTENDMQFRQCSVQEVKYIEVGGMLCKKMDIPDCQPTPIVQIPSEIEDLLKVLVLCHTVRVEHKNGLSETAYSSDGFEYEYQASSPDEKALLEAARRYGVVCHGTRSDKMEVTFRGQMRRFIQHHILDFDPTRKRMSVIVEDEQGNYMLLCKGAETAVFGRLEDGADITTVEAHIIDYAMEGLRTLVIAQRSITAEEFLHFNEIITDARTSLDNREEKLAQVFNEIEDKMRIVGVTAVEDKLQDGVPETITALRKAGIKVWVLTGDKEETAVNISYSAGHFFQGMVELRLTKCTNAEQCQACLLELKRILDDAKTYRVADHHALIIDGMSLAYGILKQPDLLREVCQSVTTVLCCRMSPLQKAQVVRLIKKAPNHPTTAAIGDGANDVSMIQEAHVGIGIMGKEGRQAVRCSDYAFGRFKFLKRATLVHGQLFYCRVTTLVQYFFFKNIAFITAHLYFPFFSAFSAQPVYDSFYLTLFNITFTSLPIFIFSLFEQHIPADDLLAKPALYKTNARNSRMNVAEFLKWVLVAFWHSVVYFFGSYAIFVYEAPLGPDGKMMGNFELGVMVYTAAILGINCKLMLEWYRWDGFAFASFAITFIGYFGSAIFYTEAFCDWLPSYCSASHSSFALWGKLSVWLHMLLLVVAAIIPDILIRASRDTFSPIYRQRAVTRVSVSGRWHPDKMSISFTKRSGVLSISQTNILEQ